MVDQNSQFYAILTNVGAAKQANADALGIPWNITQMGVGDANGTDPTPNATQTSLIKEWRRAPLNQLKVDDKDPSIIIAEQIIPADVGGHWIREIALYDSDGDMVAVANCAPTYKPLLSQGSGRTQVVRMNLIVSSSSNVQLKIDPSVVLATREYVDAAILNVLPKNKTAGTYTQVTISERGVVQQGANPTTLGGYGITDAYTKAAVDTALAGKANKATTLGGYGIEDAYTKAAVDTALASKPNKATTLAGYGIEDAYTKSATDAALTAKADNAFMIGELGKRLFVGVVSRQQPTLASPTSGLPWLNSGLIIREAECVADTNPNEMRDEYAPGLALHWGGKYAAKLYMDVNGRLVWSGAVAAYGTDSAHLATCGFVQAAVRGQVARSAKAWVNFWGVGTIGIRDSFNVSSIIDNGVGDYTVNLVVPLANTNYAVVTGGAGNDTPISGINCVKAYARAVNSFKVGTTNTATGASDFLHVDAAVYSN